MSKGQEAHFEPASPLNILCDYIHHATERPLPEAVVEKAKHHTLDTFAAMISGADLPVGKLALSYADTQGGAAQASIVGRQGLTNAVLAAQTNAMLAHADETDDSHPASIGHPGCAVVPAALAAAELANAPGTAFLRAVVLGYDMYARTNLALGPRHIYAAGRGPYSIGGAWGAAAAAAALLSIPLDRLPFVISNIAQQTSGIATWMRDTDHVEKAFHFAGMPARNGVSAATMIAHGFTGVDDALSGPGNFLEAFSDQVDPDRLTDGLGTRFEIIETNIKKWCVGSPIQSVLDSLEALMAQETIRPDTVHHVHVHLPPDMIHVVKDRGMGDINCPFCVALMIVDGAFTFSASHDENRTRDPAVIAMKERVTLHPSEILKDARPIRQAIVEIELTDGRLASHRTHVVRGAFENPMTRPEVVRKAHELIAPGLGQSMTRNFIDAVLDIDAISDIRDLRRFLQAAGVMQAEQDEENRV